MKIEKLDIGLIKPYWRNPRANDETVEKLKESIKEFGFKVPLVLDKNNVIITGHARFKALNQLKDTLQPLIDIKQKEHDKAENEDKPAIKQLINEFKELNEGKISVIIAKELNEKQAKEFRISDNRIPESSMWDMDELKNELKELEKVIGFSEEEISNLLKATEYKFEKTTADQISKAEDDFKKKFSELTNAQNKYQVEIMCPYCMEKIFIDEKELISHNKEKK